MGRWPRLAEYHHWRHAWLTFFWSAVHPFQPTMGWQWRYSTGPRTRAAARLAVTPVSAFSGLSQRRASCRRDAREPSREGLIDHSLRALPTSRRWSNMVMGSTDYQLVFPACYLPLNNDQGSHLLNYW